MVDPDLQIGGRGLRNKAKGDQPRPQGAFPWLWGRKAREKRPGDEVERGWERGGGGETGPLPWIRHCLMYS